MKKFASFLLRLIFVALVLLSGFLLLKSPVTISQPNVHKMARTTLKENIAKSGDVRLKASLELAQSLGLVSKLVDQLPAEYHYDASYASLYDLSTSYQENGEVTAKNLKLPEKNAVQKAVATGMLEKMNDTLKQNSAKIKKSIDIFHYFCFGALVVFVLAALLGLFGKYLAAAFLILGSIGTFGALQFYAHNYVRYLQEELGHGTVLTTSPLLWVGLAIGVLTALTWVLYLKQTKKNN